MRPLISNPFDGIDWTGPQIHGTTHSHIFEPTTTGISAADYLQTLIDSGYRHMAISNYNPSDPASSYPLTNLPGVTPGMITADVIECPNAEHYGFSGTEGPGHLGAPGSFFASGSSAPSGYSGSWQSWVDNVAANLQFADGGGITINHPGVSSYVGDNSAKALLDYSDLVLGIEIYDFSVDWSPDFGSNDGLALDTWHRMLVGGRRCFGFAVPDHWLESNGAPAVPRGANRLILPSSYTTADRATREHLCLQAYRNGAFYPVLSLPDSPVLSGVTVSSSQMTVDFAAACDITFYWGKYGDETARSSATTHGTSATYNFTGEEIYVRAEGVGGSQYARSFTQPIVFEPAFKPVDPAMAMAIL